MRDTSRSARALAAGAAALLMVLWLAGCGALITSPPPLHASGSTAVTRPYPTPSATQPDYSEPLTAPSAGWASGPECSFTGNGLAVHPAGGQAYICLAPAAPLADAAISVTVQQVSGSDTHGYGIAFRHNDPKSYYFFAIDGRGRFTLTVVVDDVSHTVIPFTASPAIHSGPGATNQLGVIAQGNNVTLLANGTPVGQATLAAFASGTIGLRGVNDGVVLFRQLTMYRV